jgi:hypothetical protein
MNNQQAMHFRVRKLWLKGFPFDYDEAQLASALLQWTGISVEAAEITVKKNNAYEQEQGIAHAFIKLPNETSLQEAIERLNGKRVSDSPFRQLVAQVARDPPVSYQRYGAAPNANNYGDVGPRDGYAHSASMHTLTTAMNGMNVASNRTNQQSVPLQNASSPNQNAAVLPSGVH